MKVAVVLFNLGGPDSLEAVRPFLFNLFRDPAIITLPAIVRYPLAADPTGAVSKLFGVYDPASGLALRGTFIINPDGVLVSSEVNFYNVGRDASELLRKMEANAYLVRHPDQACPAKWKPGSRTLTPSKDMVCKVF